jgi:uncharacterized protein (DUF1330 family)
MINLLKFRDVTDSGESGRDAYRRYITAIDPMLKNVGGHLLWLGEVDQVFIGKSHDEWDVVMLVEYPSRKAFLQMISDPAYNEAHKHREEALVDSALLASTADTGMMKA